MVRGERVHELEQIPRLVNLKKYGCKNIYMHKLIFSTIGYYIFLYVINAGQTTKYSSGVTTFTKYSHKSRIVAEQH